MFVTTTHISVPQESQGRTSLKQQACDNVQLTVLRVMDHVYIIEALRKDATSAAALILASTTASSAVTCVHRWSKSNSVSGAASLYLQIIQVKPNLMPCH